MRAKHADVANDGDDTNTVPATKLNRLALWITLRFDGLLCTHLFLDGDMALLEHPSA
jgi:hypothetical protein